MTLADEFRNIGLSLRQFNDEIVAANSDYNQEDKTLDKWFLEAIGKIELAPAKLSNELDGMFQTIRQ